MLQGYKLCTADQYTTELREETFQFFLDDLKIVLTPLFTDGFRQKYVIDEFHSSQTSQLTNGESHQPNQFP